MWHFLQASLIRRLIIYFLIVGLVPAVLLITIPSLYQLQVNQKVTARVQDQLQHQAEVDLNQLAQMNALRYDQFFENQQAIVTSLSNTVTHALQNSEMPLVQPPIVTQVDLLGWKVNGAKADVGYLVSPLASSGIDFDKRQSRLSQTTPFLQSVVRANPQIRTAFILTEDQTIWLYPNLFWEQGILNLPKGLQPDLTQRRYYQKVTHVIWTHPYIDIEPVITVAAPIWVDNDFKGMAGIDIRLSQVVTSTLTTKVGDNGFAFLISQNTQLIAFPDRARLALLAEYFANDPEATLQRTLLEVIPEPLQTEFQNLELRTKLTSGKPFVLRAQLAGGSAYMAFSPLKNVPWYIVIVQPEAELTRAANDLASSWQAANTRVFEAEVFTGLGFILIMFIGGIITLRQLALPLRTLAKGAEHVANGDLSHRVPIGQGHDELTVLSQTFNRMIESVQTMRDNIEHQRQTLATALQERETEFTAISAIAELANHPTDLPSNLEHALNIAYSVLGTDAVILSLMGADGHLSLTSIVCEERCKPLLIKYYTSPEIQGVAAQALREQRHILLDAQMTSESIVSIQDPNGSDTRIRKVGFRPIIAKNKVLGMLILMRCDPFVDLRLKFPLVQTIIRHLAMLIENAQLQSQNRALSIMEERRRLAAELHDSVTQSLFTLNLTTEGLKTSLAAEPNIHHEALDLIGQEAKIIQSEIRSLINELRPVDLQADGFDTALRAHVNSLRWAADIEVDLEIIGDTHLLPHSIQQNLNRIAQEAMSNIARHAQATHTKISLNMTDDVVSLTIEDDGRGFEPPVIALAESRSFGLSSMRERAEMLNGTLLVRSQLGIGTRVILRYRYNPMTPRSRIRV